MRFYCILHVGNKIYKNSKIISHCIHRSFDLIFINSNQASGIIHNISKRLFARLLPSTPSPSYRGIDCFGNSIRYYYSDSTGTLIELKKMKRNI